MLRHRSCGTVTTAVDTAEEPSERRIQRLRLTLHPTDSTSGQHDSKAVATNTEEKAASDLEWRRNGYVHPGRTADPDAPGQQGAGVANGLSERSPRQKRRPCGMAQAPGAGGQRDGMAYEWSVSHLREEMNYIREVRDSLEKMRERMYGQFGGMQQSVQKLSQDIRAANTQRRTLEAQLKVRTAAMESMDQMNSSLISSNIELQKSLLESCQDRLEKREERKSLRSSLEQAAERLREREKELAAARAENQALRLQVESSQEASSQALQDMRMKLQRQYEEKLQEEQRRHREEIEALQAQIDEYAKRLEEAEKKVRIAEAKIAERDQRISEVERLLDCMGQEKSQLQQKLQDCEERIHRLEQTDHVDEDVLRRSELLEEEAGELRERIKHLNDMVFCQQRKVKAMIEEVETLRATVAEKDLFITELLDRIAVAESENQSRSAVETREVGVGCDMPPKTETQPQDDFIFRPLRRSPQISSRLDSSILKYTPQQYSLMLQSSPSQPSSAVTSPTRSTSASRPSPAQPNPAQPAAAQISTAPVTSASTEPATPSKTSTPAASSSPKEPVSPYRKLWEIPERTDAE